MKKLFISIVAVLFAATFSFAQNSGTVDQQTGISSWVAIVQVGVNNTVEGIGGGAATQWGTGYGEFTTVQLNNTTSSLVQSDQTGATTTSYLNVAQYNNSVASFYNDQTAGNGWNQAQGYQIAVGTGGTNTMSNHQVAGLSNDFVGVQLGKGNLASVNQNSTSGKNVVLDAPNLPTSPVDWLNYNTPPYHSAAGIFQSGDNNKIGAVTVSLYTNTPYPMNFWLATVTGSGDALQTGAGDNELGISQFGNGNSVGLSQTNTAGTNVASMYQLGNGIGAAVYQDGSGLNNVLTTQTINGAQINSYQSGAISNNLNINQH